MLVLTHLVSFEISLLAIWGPQQGNGARVPPAPCSACRVTASLPRARRVCRGCIKSAQACSGLPSHKLCLLLKLLPGPKLGPQSKYLLNLGVAILFVGFFDAMGVIAAAVCASAEAKRNYYCRSSRPTVNMETLCSVQHKSK